MMQPNNETLEQFASDLEQLRNETLAKVGKHDAVYIRRLIGFQRLLDITSRLVIGFSLLFLSGIACALATGAGILALAASKILNNMEIGHNVMHGQYDWMNDPTINSVKFDWDIVGDGNSWKRYHNHEHHTYTNVIGKDRDYGYGLLRLSDDLPWKRKNYWQILTYLNLSLLFEWGVAYHELAGERIFVGKRKRESKLPISRAQLRKDFFRKISLQVLKDYVIFPLAFWPVAIPVLLCSITANLIRNLWTSTIIFCGHFTEEAHVFHESDLENEKQGNWYYRQILGSSNIEGSKLFHIMTGHLSCQIEHHLFPDIPAPYYREMAPKVQMICNRYNIPYNTGSFSKQYFEVLKRIWIHSFPDQKPERQAHAN
jgi:fatty acid desaturase